MDLSAAAHAVSFWAGVQLVMLVVLSVLVVRQRRRHRVAFGDGGIPELARAQRAFGNAIEYAPMGLVAMAVLAIAGAPPLLIHVIGLGLFAGRVSHAIGLTRTSETSMLRSAGIVVTWSSYVVAAAALLFYAVP